MKPKKKPAHRIPYVVWANSQMSIARHYGGLKINGKTYYLDFENCKTTVVDGVEKCFPDLVEEV